MQSLLRMASRVEHRDAVRRGRKNVIWHKEPRKNDITAAAVAWRENRQTEQERVPLGTSDEIIRTVTDSCVGRKKLNRDRLPNDRKQVRRGTEHGAVDRLQQPIHRNLA